MNPAQDRGLRKAGRDILQAVIAVVAGGGAYALVELIIENLNPAFGVMFGIIAKILITYAQNYMETKGSIPVVLPSPGLITTTSGGAVGTVVGTVDTVVQGTEEVIGDVVNTSGSVVGGVVGTATGLLRGQ